MEDLKLPLLVMYVLFTCVERANDPRSPGVDPGFQVRGRGALKKIAPSEGRRENLWGISCANLQGSENGRVVTIDSIHGYT